MKHLLGWIMISCCEIFFGELYDMRVQWMIMCNFFFVSCLFLFVGYDCFVCYSDDYMLNIIARK